MRMSLIEDVLSREPSDEPWPCQNIRKLLHLSIPHAAPSRYSKDPVLTDERFEPRKLANHATAQFRSLSQPGHFTGQFSMLLYGANGELAREKDAREPCREPCYEPLAVPAPVPGGASTRWHTPYTLHVLANHWDEPWLTNHPGKPCRFPQSQGRKYK